MNELISYWNGLSLPIQHVIFDTVKLALLVIITVICIKKLRRWFIHCKLENYFKIPPLEKDKKTPSATWLSTGLAFGLSISLAFMMTDQLILTPYLNAKHYSILINSWGLLLGFLFLIYFLKEILLTFRELLIQSKMCHFIEDHLLDTQQKQSTYSNQSGVSTLIHQLITLLYLGIAWLVGLILLIEFFNLSLLSALTQSFFFSIGELFVAFLMLYIGIKYFNNTKNVSSVGETQSTVILLCSVALGALIIGGSTHVFSLWPWLFLLILTGFFLVKYQSDLFSDLIAGIFLRLNKALISDDKLSISLIKLGMLTSTISTASEESKIINNSKLLSISLDKEAK